VHIALFKLLKTAQVQIVLKYQMHTKFNSIKKFIEALHSLLASHCCYCHV